MNKTSGTPARARKDNAAVQTTGHAWDGDLREYTNPLPRWWLWAFYGTVVAAVIYWVLYPAWPIGRTYTKGVLNTINYTVNGEEKSTHWNTRALLVQELQQGEKSLQQQQFMQKVAAASYTEILSNPEMMAFTRSVAKGLFGDNCAACHRAGGAGVMGLFPNLADDDWLWGGSVEDIEQTIMQGRKGFMPAFRESLNEEQLDDLSEYVLSLSGHEVSKDKAVRGGEIFNGQKGGCYYCHTTEGTGLKSVGSANLTDAVWTVADVPGQTTLQGKKAVVKQVIHDGASRTMPAWGERLTPAQVKLLSVYVHELGGGS